MESNYNAAVSNLGGWDGTCPTLSDEKELHCQVPLLTSGDNQFSSRCIVKQMKKDKQY